MHHRSHIGPVRGPKHNYEVNKKILFYFMAEKQEVDEGGELAEPLQVQEIKIN